MTFFHYVHEKLDTIIEVRVYYTEGEESNLANNARARYAGKLLFGLIEFSHWRRQLERGLQDHDDVFHAFYNFNDPEVQAQLCSRFDTCRVI